MNDRDDMNKIKEKEERNKKNYVIFLIIILLLFISIGYSLVSSNLVINGVTNIRRSEWNVHFSNVNVTNGNELTVVPPTINNTGTIVNFSVNLDNVDDKYEFVVEVYNEGTIDAKVLDCVKIGLTQEQEQYVNYNVTYLDGSSINEGDVLNAGEKKKIKVSVEYLQLMPINEDDLTNNYEVANLSYKIDYIQK